MTSQNIDLSSSDTLYSVRSDIKLAMNGESGRL
jgi:hypothetical protein